MSKTVSNPEPEPPAAGTWEPHSLHILGSRRWGGAEQFFLRLLSALTATGHPCSAAIRPGGPLARELDARALPSARIPMRNGWDILSAVAIRRLIQRSGTRVVQTYMGRASRLTRVPRRSGAVHVARLGGYYKVDGYYRHADAWVVNTAGLCDHLVRAGLPARRIHQIGNFVNPPPPGFRQRRDALRRFYGIPGEALVLLALGRMLPLKGFDLLIDALAILPAALHSRPIHLVLAGEGSQQSHLAKRAQAAGVADRVTWPGWVTDPTPLFAMADVAVIPSRREALGNVVIEAWAHGVPVVASRTPGPVELIEDGVDGLLAPVDCARGLSRALKTALEADPVQRRGLVANGAAKWRRHFSRAAVLDAYCKLYRDLTEESMAR